MKLFNSKHGYQLRDLMPIALLLLVSVIGLSIGSDILWDIKDGQCTYGASDEGLCQNSSGGITGTLGDTISSNATQGGMSGLETFGSWIPTLSLVIAAALVIGILVSAFKTG